MEQRIEEQVETKKHRCTYSPDDNKLRMYPACRLSKEDYDLFRSAGFIWATKQKLFVAPKWTPRREDLLLKFCQEIEDEDTSLVDRAEERAERFEEYSEKRLGDANRAKESVSAIADSIPFGQPILVGHHSEQRARKDAERIENGMRKAVKMWETSKYWTDRAAGALHHAKYKEMPAVRARRIKTIEAEIRQMVASYTPKNPNEILKQKPWSCPVCRKSFCEEHPEANAEIDHVWCGHSRGGSWVPVENLPKIEAYYKRWIEHCERRLLYEKAMLGEQGRLDLIEKRPKPKQLPLLNYRAPEGIMVKHLYRRGEFENYAQIEMTKAEYSEIDSDHRGTATIENSHRVKIVSTMRLGRKAVFLTDSKVHEKPEPIEKKVPVVPEVFPFESTSYHKPERSEFDDIKDTLKAGIKTVVADQLFVTPPDLAEKMIDYADLEPGVCVLEPSGGTGNLIDAVLKLVDTEVLSYEINGELCKMLRSKFSDYKLQVRQADFLTVTDFVGCYKRVIMNPPFKNGDDIKHIKKALEMLAPGGKLVAICANGPRQREQLMPIATHWEDLPEGTFKSSGTMVNAALLVIDK